jgi:putative sterol carrier protein
MIEFASPAWVDALRAEIDASTTYRKAAATWTHGALAFVVRPAASLGVPQALAMWLDLDAGRCRAARVVDEAESARAPYCLSGEYRDWRAIVRRELDPIKAIVTRRLALRGSLWTLMRYVPAAMELVSCAQRVPTRFADEQQGELR